MTTVGYGDIVAHTPNEMIFSMFTMIVSCAVFAYTVGNVGTIVSNQNAQGNAYREQVMAVNQYMKKKQLKSNLQHRVRRYLEYIWDHKKRNNLDENEILELLSAPLRDEVYAQIHGAYIETYPVFKEYEAYFLSQLSRTMSAETYGPGDSVIDQGELSFKLYFIQHGVISIFHKATKSAFQQLTAMQHFGEIAFFTEKPRCASAKCVDYVDLLSMNRLKVDTLLMKFPEAMEQTKAIAKRCEDGDYEALLIYCYICKDLGHVASNCRNILLNADQHETKQKWLEQKQIKKSKYINIIQSQTQKSRTKRNRHMNPHISKRNVAGSALKTVKLFPKHPFLLPKIQKYIDSLNKHPPNYAKSTASDSSQATYGVLTPTIRHRRGSVSNQLDFTSYAAPRRRGSTGNIELDLRQNTETSSLAQASLITGIISLADSSDDEIGDEAMDQPVLLRKQTKINNKKSFGLNEVVKRPNRRSTYIVKYPTSDLSRLGNDNGLNPGIIIDDIK